MDVFIAIDLSKTGADHRFVSLNVAFYFYEFKQERMRNPILMWVAGKFFFRMMIHLLQHGSGSGLVFCYHIRLYQLSRQLIQGLFCDGEQDLQSPC